MAASAGDEAAACEALEELCERYWYPLYAFARRQGLGSHDAQDATQGFLADLLRREDIRKIDPERGKFRSFLLAGLRNFIANEFRRQRTEKRGGGELTISIDQELGEQRFKLEPASEESPESLYERGWAMALLAAAVERLENEYRGAISPGDRPIEASQTVAFSFEVLSEPSPTFFSTPPAATPDGTLSFAIAPGEFGAAVVRATLTDDLGGDSARLFRIHSEGLSFRESFDTPAAFFSTGANSWEWGTASGIPASPDGGAVWGTDLDGDYGANEAGFLQSPPVDLSSLDGLDGVGMELSWWQFVDTEADFDFASVEISRDGGASFTSIGGPESGAGAGWEKVSVLLDASYAVPNVILRFRLASDGSVTAPGFYIDGIEIAPIALAPCAHADFEEIGESLFSSSGAVSSWEQGTPSSGPGVAVSGLSVWATNLNGSYLANESSYLESLPVDTSNPGASSVHVRWHQFVETEANFDTMSVEATKDGGASWQPVADTISGASGGWQLKSAELDASYAVADFQMRFSVQADSFFQLHGIYIDAVSICTRQGAAFLVPPGELGDWRALHFTANELGDPSLEARLWGSEADPDGDGTPNDFEMFAGGDPLVSDPGGFVSIGPGGFEFVRDLSVTAFSWRVEWSPDLVNWSGAGVAETVVNSEGNTETRRAEVAGVSGRIFMRLTLER